MKCLTAGEIAFHHIIGRAELHGTCVRLMGTPGRCLNAKLEATQDGALEETMGIVLPADCALHVQLPFRIPSKRVLGAVAVVGVLERMKDATLFRRGLDPLHQTGRSRYDDVVVFDLVPVDGDQGDDQRFRRLHLDSISSWSRITGKSASQLTPHRILLMMLGGRSHQ